MGSCQKGETRGAFQHGITGVTVDGARVSASREDHRRQSGRVPDVSTLIVRR